MNCFLLQCLLSYSVVLGLSLSLCVIISPAPNIPYEILTPQMNCFMCLHIMVPWRATNHCHIWCRGVFLFFVFALQELFLPVWG